MENLKLTVVYDNHLHNERLKSGWGFSCLAEYSDKKILFDTGDNPEKLSFNLDALGINPQDFQAVVLSHNHWDHTGGLQALAPAKNYKLYFGKSYPARFQGRMKSLGINFFLVDDLRRIEQDVYAGPQMAALGIKEIPLTLKTPKGLVIITGCAHPGILKIIKRLKEELQQDVYLVLGGFHLGAVFALEGVVAGFRKTGVVKVAPCHCTGERAIALFERYFKQDFIRVGSGVKIEI